MDLRKQRNIVALFIIGYLAYSAIYIARLNFSTAATLFEELGKLDKTQISLIGSIFSLVYAFAKIPNGYIGDRISAKSVVVCGLAVVGISNLLIGIFPNFISILILWGVNAFGQSMLWGPLLRIFAANCEDGTFRKVSKLLGSAVAVGSIIGLLLAGVCVSAGSVVACFLFPSAFALIMAVIVKLFFADAKGDKKPKEGNIVQSFARLIQQAKFRWIIFPAVAHGIIKDNINVWMAVYVVDVFGIDLKVIAGYVFVVPLFGFVGRMLYMPVYRWLKSDYKVSMVSFGACAVITAILCVPNVTAMVAIVCLGLISALISMINVHFLSAFPSEYAEQNCISLVASAMDVLTYSGAGIGTLCFGVLIQHFGYSSMFLIWIVISLVSVFFLQYMRKT